MDITALKLRQNTPLPPTRRPQKSKYDALFSQMDVGDSILFPPGAIRSTVASVARNMSQRFGIKLTVRPTPDGFGVWRVG